ncbi:MAG: hypothetical protein ABIP17_16640 [Ilumatobacteraceae bacterium]
MSTRSRKLSALIVLSALAVAACGGDDDTTASDPTTGESAAPTTDAPPTEATEASSDESTAEMSAESSAESSDESSAESAESSAEESSTAMSEESSSAEPQTSDLITAFDANGDGTVTIGVAAAGPRDDNGSYQSLVDFAEQFSTENGFADPIVSDNIGSEEAAQAMSDLAQQGVDIMFVGASEIAEPLPDLTEAFPDIFWYCNCGAGFEELPGLAQATDWGAAIHYTAGVAMGEVMVEQGSTQSVFLGCCDLNFEREAYNATVAGMQSVQDDLTMEYVATGDFPFDFDNSANATAALTNAISNGATLAYAYLGGALEPVGQLATEQGVAVFAAGPADICERDDGIDWAGSIVFDGGLYAAQALRLIIADDLDEGATYQFPTEQGLNGAVLCDPSPDAASAVADAFALLASFDDDLMAQLGAISGEAYSGG